MIGPGGTIGFLGGGQLARMMAMAAARLGLRAAAYDPDPDAPAGQVAALTTAAWDDAAALASFAQSCDVLTWEFENVPEASLNHVEAHATLHPPRRALAVSQDRLDEKAFLASLGLAVAPHARVDGPGDLTAAGAVTGWPAILKTRTLGYDGKGQARLDAPDPAAWEAIGAAPAILEGLVPFEREVSVIGARDAGGAVACYDPAENVHEGGILRTSTVPARLPPSLRSDAVLVAARILSALDYVGVLGVELFVTRAGLVVNEIAPRVHNSGHWTEAACAIDQFEQHVRAVCGWPLGDGSRHSDAVMENLIGEDVARAPQIARTAAHLHLYGKAEVRPGRKMGHATRLTGPA
ncbi:MAG: 5-(carboxyamino)imidazole ribonucleotide synthase [Paracoccaceae bacterium]